jgi:three-Cys-motif partner protein
VSRVGSILAGMSDRSAIEWTDATWNPVRGCTKISPGCAHCYAETFAERFRGVAGHPYEQGFDLRLVPDKLTEPLQWRQPRMIFVNSMSDLFHKDVPDDYIRDVCRVMASAHRHVFQVLTKRSERLYDLLQGKLSFAARLSNIWWGVSVEDRKHGLPRLERLRAAPATIRFLSVEPLLERLGPLDLTGVPPDGSGLGTGHPRPMRRRRCSVLLQAVGRNQKEARRSRARRPHVGRIARGRTRACATLRLRHRLPPRCKFGGETKPNGNCSVSAPDDGLPVQCLGPWSRDKHDYVRRYLTASGEARRRYLPPRGPGGAAFIDLFAGPGRGRLSTTGEMEDGSPLIALRQPVPFTKLILCEMDTENLEALKQRTAAARVSTVLVPGDCNATIDQVAAETPKYGLNVGLVDPYNLEVLSFSTIGRLAAFQRMDLIVFFPIGEIRRNIERNRATYIEYLDRALGTNEWQPVVKTKRDVTKLIGIFRRQLETRFGYTAGQVRTAAIRNEKNVALYHLIFASKHSRGDAIWDSVTRRAPGGQRKLF